MRIENLKLKLCYLSTGFNEILYLLIKNYTCRYNKTLILNLTVKILKVSFNS